MVAKSRSNVGQSDPSSAADPLTGSEAGDLAVRGNEDPWSAAEIAEVRDELLAERARLLEELGNAERDHLELVRQSGEGAGDDQADAGAATWEREHEMSLVFNSRSLFTQTEHALERIAEGTYGICEDCGTAVGKMRLQAFPRATLCLTCKAKTERR